jgi:hypothetical protein
VIELSTNSLVLQFEFIELPSASRSSIKGLEPHTADERVCAGGIRHGRCIATSRVESRPREFATQHNYLLAVGLPLQCDDLN